MTENILVIKLGALGDFIQTMGPMAAIRQHHKSAKITLLTTKGFVGLAKDCGYFDDIWIDERPKLYNIPAILRLRSLLLSGDFHRIYDLQTNDRTGLYFRLLGAPKHNPEWIGIAKGAAVRNTDPQRSKDLAFYGHKQTLEMAGIKNIEIDRLKWAKGKSYKDLGLQKPYALFVPGCSPQHPNKRWPADGFSAVANHLASKGVQPVILGTNIEADIVAEICTQAPDAVNLSGKTSISDIITLADDAHFAVGNDTGPMHIIGPTGCKTLVLFSQNSNPDLHRPLGESIDVIMSDDLKDLYPKEVIEKIQGYL